MKPHTARVVSSGSSEFFGGDCRFNTDVAVVGFHPFRMKTRTDICFAPICDPPQNRIVRKSEDEYESPRHRSAVV